MTRYTNIGIKRTFLQAGFKDEGGVEFSSAAATSSERLADSSTSPYAETVEGKRKRSKKSRAEPSGEGEAVTAAETTEAHGKSNGKKFDKQKFNSKRVNASGYLKRKQRDQGQSASEQRRLQRIEERQANTICFACREKGHAAKDCPTATGRSKGQGEALDEEEGQRRKKDVPLTGICYRCGSMKHSLSRCRIPEDPSNPLPFASCFVCSGKGHLASKCPQNKSKGVYPNGGSCRLCGETSHLAKDCGLRKQEKLQGTVILGTGDAVGADEDDFHSVKRTTVQMDREERNALKLSKKLAKTAALTDVRRQPISKAPPAKKVVVF